MDADGVQAASGKAEGSADTGVVSVDPRQRGRSSSGRRPAPPGSSETCPRAAGSRRPPRRHGRAAGPGSPPACTPAAAARPGPAPPRRRRPRRARPDPAASRAFTALGYGRVDHAGRGAGHHPDRRPVDLPRPVAGRPGDPAGHQQPGQPRRDDGRAGRPAAAALARRARAGRCRTCGRATGTAASSCTTRATRSCCGPTGTDSMPGFGSSMRPSPGRWKTRCSGQ